MSASQLWKEYTLGELATYLNGRAFKPSDWGKTGLAIVRIQNLTDYKKPFNYFDGPVEDKYLIDTGELLISWSATLGSYIWNKGMAILNQHIFKVIPNESIIDKEFLHYLALNTLSLMAEHAHGLAMKHITKAKFEALIVKVPVIEEQHRIVAHIKECMERVEEIERLRNEIIEDTRAMLHSTLNEIFVALRDTYGTAHISDVIIETRYGTSQKCSTSPDGTAILRIPNIAGGYVNFENLKYCHVEETELKRIALKKGDLLFVRTNGSRDLVGRCAIYEGNGGDLAYGFASYLIRVRLDFNKIRPHFLAFFLNSSHGRKELDKRRRTSAGQFNINSENLCNIEIPLPPTDVQDSINKSLSYQQELILRMQSELIAAQQEESHLRDSILRKAFAGEL